MRKLILVISTLFLCLYSEAQQATLIKLPQLESLIGNKTDTTYIVNFWATWCKPCVKELPVFRAAEEKYKNTKVRFIYISLDFKRELNARLNVFLKENNFNSEVYLIDEPDYDAWINKVSTDWQGNIPATLIYNHSKGLRNFYAKEFEEEELREILVKTIGE